MNLEQVTKIKRIKYPQIAAHLKSIGAVPKTFPPHSGKGDYWVFMGHDNEVRMTLPLPHFDGSSSEDHLLYAWESIAHGFKKLCEKEGGSVDDLIEGVLRIQVS